MLILARSIGSAIVIGDDIVIRVKNIENGGVVFEITLSDRVKNGSIKNLVESLGVKRVL